MVLYTPKPPVRLPPKVVAKAASARSAVVQETPASYPLVKKDDARDAPREYGREKMYTTVISMEEAKDLADARNQEVKAASPYEILEDMKQGNLRFWTGETEQADHSLIERRALIYGQAPKVMVLGCADSRVPIEIVLDQGLGDVFVARNAGNLWGDTVAGTIDYGVNHLGIKLIVVMGHQGCGAVKASRLPFEAIMKEPPKLRTMLLGMRQSLEYCSETLDNIQDSNARDRESVIANAQAQVRKIIAEENVGSKVRKGDVLVIAAFYEIASGIVDFIEAPPPVPQARLK